MPTNYPAGLDSFTNPSGSDTLASPPHHSQHADVNDAVEAIEAELGVNPSGGAVDVGARIAGHDHTGGEGAQVDHGGLAGLADDDHSQYLNVARHAAIDAADHGSGSAAAGRVLTADGAGGAAWLAGGGGGDVVYADNGDTVAINSTTDVTVKSAAVTGVGVGDTIVAELVGTLLQNSVGARTYVLTPDFDAAFDPELTITGVSASATNLLPFRFRWQLTVVSTSLAKLFVEVAGVAASGFPAGTYSVRNVQLAWDTVSADLTGSVDVALKVRSDGTGTTQEFLVYSFVVRHIPST